jgi:hypothetical protein
MEQRFLMTSALHGELAASLAASLGPYAGEAAALTRALVTQHVIDPDNLQLPSWRVLKVVEDLARRGWMSFDGRVCRLTATAPPGLPEFLAGLDAMGRLRPDSGTFRVVVTSPTGGGAFARALVSTGMARANLIETADAMRDVAMLARHRLVVMSPFLNDEGVELVLDLFGCSPAPEKILIVRHRGSTTKQALRQSVGEFRRHRITVMNYLIRSDERFETFHAKVVLADEQGAYVGSANMLRYEISALELGVIAKGRGVEVVRAAVDAAIACASPLALP